jgi:YidC/Oxa1 family membrane protein insertase
MTTLLLATTIFLGINLIMGPQRANQDTRTSKEILAKMQEHNAKLMDLSIQQELTRYESKFNEEANRDKVPQSQRDRAILGAYALVADTIQKSALYREELNKQGKSNDAWAYRKLDKAYTFIKPKFEQYYLAPVWAETVVAVAPSEKYPAGTRSPKEIYDTIVKDLSPLAEREPVFGFIPGYQLIDVLVQITGATAGFSYWFAAFLLACIVRAIIWPLAQKQIIHGRQMARLQPMIKELNEKHKDKKTGQVKDPQKLQAETFAIYNEYGLNPFAGCLPALIQMPLFLTVFQSMHHYKFEFVKGTFAWVNPGSDRFLGIPLAPNLGERDYVLIVIYTISMVVSTLLTPISDPSNAKQQRIMGVSVALIASVFMFFYTLPAAFTLYWIFTNVLSTAQSLLSYRLPLPELQKKQTVTGGKVIDTFFSQVVNGANSSDQTNGSAEPKAIEGTSTPLAKKQRKRK